MGVRLKNEHQSPIGGWQFVDAPISSEPITEWSVGELVEAVKARRKQNPRFGLSLDPAAIKRDVMQQNALRMTSIRGGEHYLVDAPNEAGPPMGGGGPFSPPRSHRRGAVAAVRNTSAGIAVLLDWLGEGAEPVDLPVAEERAKICAGCPKNQPADWLAVFTDPVAAVIRKQLSIKNDMELKTSVDDQLNVCRECGCSLKLKCWVPIEHILKHTSEDVKGKLDPRCWILK
jgi:hypothetical protein